MIKTMTFEEWVKEYKPLHGVNAQEYASTHPRTAWSLMSGDENEPDVLFNGWRWVNATEHYVTEIPYNEDDTIVVESEHGFPL